MARTSSRSDYKFGLIVMVILLLLGIGGIYYAFMPAPPSWRRVMATVNTGQGSSCKGGHVSATAMEVTYELDGKPHTATGLGSCIPEYKVNDKVHIVVNPQNPSFFRLAEVKALILGPIFALILSLFTIISYTKKLRT